MSAQIEEEIKMICCIVVIEVFEKA